MQSWDCLVEHRPGSKLAIPDLFSRMTGQPESNNVNKKNEPHHFQLHPHFEDERYKEQEDWDALLTKPEYDELRRGRTIEQLEAAMTTWMCYGSKR